MLRLVRQNESSRRLWKRRFEAGWSNDINWPCGPKKSCFGTHVENAEDMRELLDGDDFVYLRSDLGGGSCAVEVFNNCVKLYHMRLTASHDSAREKADSVISLCTKSYGSQDFLDCDEEKFISMFADFMLSYDEYEDFHTCEAEKIPAVTLKYPINREHLDAEILKIIEHPKNGKYCVDIAYDMMDELANDGIYLADYEEDDGVDYFDEDEEYESRRRNVLKGLTRLSREMRRKRR